MKKAACYVRVSTEEQRMHGLSVDNQIDSLIDYCKTNVYEPVLYSDAGISAHVSYKKRPALLNLIEDCKSEKIEIIFFTRLDRWFRSVKDYYLVMDQIGNVPWRAIWEDYETETSSGQLKVNIMLAVAEAEATRTGEKIKSVLDWKRSNGEWIGDVPTGFKVVDKRLVVDQDKQELVENIFKTYLRTYSAEETRRIVGRSVTASGIRYMLKNKNYIGTYITQEQHDLIMSISAKRTRRSKNYVYMFSGLVTCPKCGTRLASCSTSSSKGLRCQNGCKSFTISDRKLEKLCLNALAPALDEAKIKASTSSKKDDFKARKKLLDKISRSKELYIEGDISKEVYLIKKAEIERELNEIQPEKTISVELPAGWREAYNKLNEDNRAAFWKSICSGIRLTEDKKIDHFIFL